MTIPIVVALTAAMVTATSATAASVSAEGESLTISPGAGAVTVDNAASAGKALLLWANGTATGTVTTAAPATRLTVRARGDLCQGAPTMTVLVDGTAAGKRSVTGAAWADLTFTGSWGSGGHVITISYDNDLRADGCDRNLLLDRVTLSDATTVPGSAALQIESLTVPGGAGAVYSDSVADAGRYLLLWSGATVTGTITTDLPSTGLTIRARGDQCQGAPNVEVSVDGRVAGTVSVGATSWTSYTVAESWVAGRHTVGLRFTNDLYAGGCDRNLRLDSVSLATGTVVTTPPPAPVNRSFGLSQNDGPRRGLDNALATAARLNQHLDEFNIFMAWAYQDPFPTDVVRATAAAGAMPSITWEPWDPSAGATQPTYRLQNIIDGRFDAYIDSWARDAAAFGQPLTLRFAHEMNAGWYPWGAAANGNNGADYIAAYRHVHDRFTAAGATNVQWSWSINIVQGMPVRLADVFPGASYVDSVGVDGYNGGTDNPGMGGWKSPSAVFGDTLAQLAVLTPGTPVYIAETASAVGGGDKAAWTAQLIEYLRTTPVTGVDWFNLGGYPDWRITSSTAVTDAARKALASW